MRSLFSTLLVISLAGVPATLSAQQGPPPRQDTGRGAAPGRRFGPGGPAGSRMGAMPFGAGAPMGAPAVEMLLGHTGELQLTDQQVVRLAAIARRADERRRALRTRLDSLRPRFAPGDSAARRDRRPAPPADVFERERDATHNDLRDALAVLTADQQARAWEMMSGRGPGRGAFRAGR